MTATQGDLLAFEAIERVERNADQDWMWTAKQVLWAVIKLDQEFTTDALWERLDAMGVSTHEPRAMGAVLQAAARAGYIRATGEYVKSTRPTCHSRPIPVWIPVRTTP